MKLTVHGAARTTTGSMYLLEVAGKKVVFECGFFQGSRKESMDRNHQFPFKPSEIDFVLLSHAHIDHSGNIPNLVRQGFEGPIFCNHATRDLTAIMLEDSAHIQEADCAFINRRNEKLGKKDAPIAEPLYTRLDAQIAAKSFMSIAYDRPFALADGINVMFSDAGHILGSSEITFDLEENGRKLRLVFSGDVGRGNSAILRDPTPFQEAEVLIFETTYGGRLHEPMEAANKKFGEIIQKTLDRGGKIIIPAFSTGRTQQLIYALNELTKDGKLPKIPIYVDSPLSMNITEVFRMHPECFNRPTYDMLRRNQNPFSHQNLTYIRSSDESKSLNERSESCIIISASGMCEAGRIRHHLKNNIGNPKNTVFMVGFCAPNTLGRALADRHSKVSIFGEEYDVKAEVQVMDAFSAHADRNELLSLISKSTGPMNQIILTHGQEDQAEALAKSLQIEHSKSKINIPKLHDTIEL
jgi:metallo-beta-lactamase family protein